MSTYTQTLYHIVFSTKHRVPVLLQPRRRDLYAYLWGVLKKVDCHLYRMNGIEDHVHIATSLHSSIALADLIRDLKTSSSSWIKRERLFPHFDYWQEGYGAFTMSWESKDELIEYIKNQEEHHNSETSVDELKRLLRESGVPFDEKYLE